MSVSRTGRTLVFYSGLVLLAAVIFWVLFLYRTNLGLNESRLSAGPQFADGKSIGVNPIALQGISREVVGAAALDTNTRGANELFSRARKDLRKQYAKFLENAGLSPSDQELFLDLVTESALLGHAFQEGMRNGTFATLDEADRFVAKEDARLADQLRWLLGERYPNYWVTTQQIPIRRELEIFAQQQKRNGLPLTPDQFDELVYANWDKYASMGVDIFYNTAFSQPKTRADLVAKARARTRADNALFIDLTGLLSEQQLLSLKEFKKEQVQGMIVYSMRPRSVKPGP